MCHRCPIDVPLIISIGDDDSWHLSLGACQEGRLHCAVLRPPLLVTSAPALPSGWSVALASPNITRNARLQRFFCYFHVYFHLKVSKFPSKKSYFHVYFRLWEKVRVALHHSEVSVFEAEMDKYLVADTWQARRWKIIALAPLSSTWSK